MAADPGVVRLSAPAFDWSDPAEAQRASAAAAPLLPPSMAPLFDSRFTRSHILFDEYVHRLVPAVMRAAGLEPALADWGSVEEFVTRAGLDPARSVVPLGWMLRHVAARGDLAFQEQAGSARFRGRRALPNLDPAPVLEAQRAHDPGALPSYAVADTAAREYPAFLRGERTGEEILFAPARLALWTGYFSNDNALYAVNNRVGAAALEAWLRPGPARILELGGGLGSATAAVLERLSASGRLGDVDAYRFTELVPAFLRRAQRVAERFPDARGLTFAALDMNRPFAEQGVAPDSVSVVYAVNTLHVAHDLAFTLGEIRRALAPGGQVILSECVRPLPRQTLYPEFVFNLLETFRAGGFLTAEQWTAALDAAGFADVRVLPDIASIRKVVSNFYVAAVGATRRA